MSDPEETAQADGTAARRPWLLAARVIAVQVATLVALWLLQSTYG